MVVAILGDAPGKADVTLTEEAQSAAILKETRVETFDVSASISIIDSAMDETATT